MYDFWTPPLPRAGRPEGQDPRDPSRSDRAISIRTQLRRQRWRGGPSARPLTQLANSNLWRSLYFAQLTRLLEHFDRAQLLVLQYERCAEDPVSELHRTYEFLDLDPPDHLSEIAIHDQVGGLPWPNAELPGG